MNPFNQKLFVGRSKELKSLEDNLLNGSKQRVCIVGARGVGKTALALRFAQQHRKHFTGGVHLINATELESLEESVKRRVAAKGDEPHLLILKK